MKKLFSLLILSLLPCALFAQGNRYFIQELTSAGTTGGSVSIKMDHQVQSALRAHVVPEKIQGYRVCIFSDNGQTARNGAQNAIGLLQKISPATSADIVYTEPFFRVYAGNYITKAEAAILLGQIKSSMPSAFIVIQAMPAVSITYVAPAGDEGLDTAPLDTTTSTTTL